jgi:adenylate cyclase, class 2
MNFEVEQKHRVDDPAGLKQRLADRGVALQSPIEQADTYFAHPGRDFAQTDEALRIRTVGSECFVTYKGPKLDATSKTRREIELPLAVGASEFTELLTALGFEPVLTVRKTRRPFEIEHQGRSVHGAWDEIDEIGTFVELELTADESSLEAARSIIADLAGVLLLGPSERRSYLELLLARNGQTIDGQAI